MSIAKRDQYAPSRGNHPRSQNSSNQQNDIVANTRDPSVIDDWEPNIPISIAEIEAIDHFLAEIIDAMFKHIRRFRD